MFFKMIMKIFWWLLVNGWMPDAILRWKIRNGLKELLAKMDKEETDQGFPTWGGMGGDPPPSGPSAPPMETCPPPSPP